MEAHTLAQLHAERLARRPPRTTYHFVKGLHSRLAVVEQHGAQLGSSLWDAALPFAEWLLAHPQQNKLWDGSPKRILELGAGCGSSGIAAALGGYSGQHILVLTDKLEVCPHLKLNVEANAKSLLAKDCSAYVLPLHWRMGGSQVLETAAAGAEWLAVLDAAGGAFDLVIAAECVYDLGLLQAMLDTIARALAGSPCSIAILGFCRRGGTLCNKGDVDKLILQQFQHVELPTTINLSTAGMKQASSTDQREKGSDTSRMFIYQLKLRS